jgi:hypothetical protein
MGRDVGSQPLCGQTFPQQARELGLVLDDQDSHTIRISRSSTANHSRKSRLLNCHSDKLFASSDSFVACVAGQTLFTWVHPQAPAVVGANSSS